MVSRLKSWHMLLAVLASSNTLVSGENSSDISSKNNTPTCDGTTDTCGSASFSWNERQGPVMLQNQNEETHSSVIQELLSIVKSGWDWDWDEFSPEIVNLLESRGCTEYDYNYIDDEMKWYDFLYWNEVHEEKQKHLTALGWNEKAWDLKLNSPIVFERPLAEVRPWGRLSEEDKKSAESLGFSAELWHVRDWVGDREFNPFKISLDIPKLEKLNLDYLAELDIDVKTIPEAEKGGDDEMMEYVSMPIKEYIKQLREGSLLYMKYEDNEQGLISDILGSVIKEEMSKVLEDTPLKDIGRFGPEYEGEEFHEFTTLYVGGVNTTSHVHLDHQTFNFIWVTEGRKRVVLIPNDPQSSLQVDLIKEAAYSVWPGVDVLSGPLPPDAVEFILGPGEGMQIPYYSWHAVQNLEPSVSYGLIRDWPETRSFKYVPDTF